MTVIGLLHPGEMGAAVAAQLHGVGHDVLWSSAGRSADTAARADAAGMIDAGSLANLQARSELILSVCPPHAAVDVAGQLRGFTGPYVDANAIAPATVRLVAPLQPRLIDGGIVGAPPVSEGTTRLYLSGPDAEATAALFSGTVIDVRVVSEEIGAASAVKMAYAAWTKGTAALLLAVRGLARAEGVDDALVAEWETSQPQLATRLLGAAESAVTKGWRWRGEMEEIAASFDAVGLPEGFHLAAAEVFGASPRVTAEGEAALDAVLAALLSTDRPG